MDRRQFFKVTAASGSSAILASCGNPENQLIRFIPEEELTPGISVWKPSICPLCPAGCGVQVRVMEGEAEVVRNGRPGLIKMGLAKKLEGNPVHPISQGKLCVRGQAAIQVTYHPDRIQNPLKRSGERGSGQFQEITWDEALAELVSKLDELAAAGDGKSLAFLTKPISGQRQVLVSQFLSRFGAPAAMEFEVFGDHVLRRANGRSFGYAQLPTIDIQSSGYVISFGADFLGTWNSPVAQSVAYGTMRKGRPGKRAKFVQVEARMSQTGANADEWIPAKPGTEGILALGLAHVIMRDRLRPPSGAARAGAQIDGWSDGLTAYTPEEVENRTGIPAARIERLAAEFANHSPAVAIIAGAPLAHMNGLFNALAVNALNALVGSIGQPGGIFFTPKLIPETGPQTGSSLASLSAQMLQAQAPPVKLLLLNDTNPVFGAPSAWRVKEALSKVPFIVSFGSFIDETSILADMILPDHSFLESWVDHVPESGAKQAVASVAPPAMKPLYQTRAMPDVLLDVSRRLSSPLSPALPQTYEEMLQTAFGSLPGDTDWTKAQEQGGWWGEAGGSASAVNERPGNLTEPVVQEPHFDGDPAQYPYHFLPFASQAFFDGSLAHLPWLQELPDALSTAMWSSWVEINPKTAEQFGIVDGDLLEVASGHGTLQAPALVSPGIAPDVIAMPVGQGHEAFTRYATGRGANPVRILAAQTEPETGSVAWAATRVRISKVSGRGDLILFAGSMREHPEHEHR